MFVGAQTFYVDPNAVSNSDIAFITSVDLYFSAKPTNINNVSGILNPGVDIVLAQVTGNLPDLNNIISGSLIRKEYDQIYALSDASVGTKFSFKRPIQVKTGQSYAILFKFDDPAYNLWFAISGNILLNTNTIYPGVNNFHGSYFDISNNGNWQALNDREVKFDVNVAQFSSFSETFEMVNKNYEFLTLQLMSNTSVSVVNAGASTVNTVVYITNPSQTIWTVPSNWNNTANRVDLVGGGGGGAGGSSLQGGWGGAAGGGGGFSRYTNFTFTPGSNVTISVGSGGVGGGSPWASGSPGGQTLFSNSSFTANGGGAGTGGDGGAGGAGGVGATSTGGAGSQSQNIGAGGGGGGGAGGPHGNGDAGVDTYEGVDGAGDAGYSPLNQTGYQTGYGFAPGAGQQLYGGGGHGGAGSGYGVFAHPGSPGTSGAPGFIRIEWQPIDYVIKTVNVNSNYLSGELVFVDNLTVANGTVSYSNTSNVVTGSNTLFTQWYAIGDFIAFDNGNTKFVSQIWDISSNTQMIMTSFAPCTNTVGLHYRTPVASLSFQNQTANVVVLTDSNASNTVYFKPGNILRGTITSAQAIIASVNDLPIHQFYSEFLINQSTATVLGDLVCNFANTSYDVDPTREENFVNGQLFRNFDYNAIIASRSNEVNNANNLYSNSKSSVIQITVSVNPQNSNLSLYESPSLFGEKLDLFLGTNQINDDDSNETTSQGDALCKHITTKVVTKSGEFAAGLLVNLNAYKPSGTDIEVYARIQNSKDPTAFSDLPWTQLSYANNTETLTSSSTNLQDFKALQFELPNYPNVVAFLAGSVSTTNNSPNVVGQGTTWTSSPATAGDIVRIYSPLNPNNYVIGVINTVSSNTLIILNNPITVPSMIGSGYQMDIVANTAFAALYNFGISKYFNSNLSEYDYFDSFALKIVLLAQDPFVYPRINNLQALAISV